MNDQTTFKRRGRAAFTLIELMAVVAIIGILASVGVSRYMTYREVSLGALCASNLKQIYNGTLASFSMTPSVDAVNGRWNGAGQSAFYSNAKGAGYQAVIVCPMKGTYTFANNAMNDTYPTCSLYSADPVRYALHHIGPEIEAGTEP